MTNRQALAHATTYLRLRAEYEKACERENAATPQTEEAHRNEREQRFTALKRHMERAAT